MNGVSIYPVEKAAAIKIKDEYDYGTQVSLDKVYRMLEVEELTGKHTNEEHEEHGFIKLARMVALRKILLEDYKILFRNVKGEGYELIMPSEQTLITMTDYSKRIGKIAHEAVSRLTNTAYDMLSEMEVQENINAQGKIAAINAMMDRQLGLPAPAIKKLKADD